MAKALVGLMCLTLGGLADISNADPQGLGFVDTFKGFDSSAWAIAEYNFGHPHFDTDWKKANALFGTDPQGTDEGLRLNLSPQHASASGNRFVGASVRRTERTHYGRYETWIKPAKGSGVITGFFTYTGPHYGTQHDEIDIEFLGKNTRQIHIAWFQDGTLTNKFIDLPFDAADKARKYAFDWLPDRIDWYVEDTLIFSIHQTESKLPKTPSMLFANIWAADHSIAIWSGKTAPHQTGTAWFGTTRFIPYRGAITGETLAASGTIPTTESASLASLE